MLIFASFLLVTFSINNAQVTVEVFTGTNYKKWKEDILFAVEAAEIGSALKMDKPADLTLESTEEQKLHYAKWERCNRFCLLTMRRTIQEHLKCDYPEECTAKEFFEAISQHNRVSSHAEISSLMQVLFSMRYNRIENIRDYIMRMVQYQMRLKALGMVFSEQSIVHQALISFPADYTIIKTFFNNSLQDWTVDDLIEKLIAEDNKLKFEKSHSTLFSHASISGKGKRHLNQPQRESKVTQPSNKVLGSSSNRLAVNMKNIQCLFCKKMGHVRKDCRKFKKWLAKRQGVHNQEEAKP